MERITLSPLHPEGDPAVSHDSLAAATGSSGDGLRVGAAPLGPFRLILQVPTRTSGDREVWTILPRSSYSPEDAT